MKAVEYRREWVSLRYSVEPLSQVSVNPQTELAIA